MEAPPKALPEQTGTEDFLTKRKEKSAPKAFSLPLTGLGRSLLGAAPVGTVGTTSCRLQLLTGLFLKVYAIHQILLCQTFLKDSFWGWMSKINPADDLGTSLYAASGDGSC